MARVREILLPWDQQPQEAADVNPGAAFIWTPSQGLTTPALGRQLTVAGTVSETVSRYGRSAELAHAASLSATGYYPITTSDGAYTGDFIVAVLANSPSGAVRGLLSQRSDTGAAFSQLNLNANTDASLTPTAGSLALVTYSGTFTGVAFAGAIDGNYHVFAGRRVGTTLELWVDGVLRASNSGTIRAVGVASGGGSGGLGIGIALPTFNNNTAYDTVFVGAWNTGALDMAALSSDVWKSAFAPRSIPVPVSVAGGATTHATTGALAGAGGAVSGTAAHISVHGTTGALAGDGGAVAGSAARTRAHPTTGVLSGSGGVIDGAAARTRVHPTSGVLAGDGGSISGAADHVVPGGTHDTSGALSGAGGAVAGSAAHIAIHGTSGALEGAGGSISGTAAHVVVHGTSGVLAGSGGAVAGDAARVAAAVTHDTSGALSGGGGAVSGDARGPDADGGGMGFSMSRMRRLVKIKFNGKLYQALEDQIPELLETLEEQAQQKVTKKRNAKSKPAPVATVVSAPADVLPSLSARIADVNRAIGDLWRVDEDEDEEILWLML